MTAAQSALTWITCSGKPTVAPVSTLLVAGIDQGSNLREGQLETGPRS
jgi:hypothetical protein